MLMNVGGLKVVMPSTPADAKGLMLAAIRDPNPVLYFQDAVLGGTKGPVPEGSYEVPLGVADVKREGTDVTVVAIGALVPRALRVAQALEQEQGLSVEVVDPRMVHDAVAAADEVDASVEVIDLRTVAPLDTATILESVRKTGRLVVCDSAKLTCSAASEIAAMVAQKAFGSLRAAPLRVAWENVPIPFSPVLEKRVLVGDSDIREAILQTVRERVPA
jgi:pyruvate dehydrogenase E1 component beta subunit